MSPPPPATPSLPHDADRTPAVSVVVPAYNVAGFIGPCLDSVLAQSLLAWECLVVDDGSRDDTAERVTRFTDPRIRLLRQANGGVSAARNAGLAAARGTAVMFLDGDDLLHPTALARLDAALRDHAGAVAAFGSFVKLLADGTPYPQQKPLAQHRYPSGDVLLPMIRENFLANGGHVLVRTDAAQRIGGFDVALRLSEDWEFWCRLAAQGTFQFIGPVPEVFSLRVRPGSASGPLAADWANHQHSLDAVLGNPELRRRFEHVVWQALGREVRASHMWEAGRVNFTIRRFPEARRLMLRSLRLAPRRKRLALFLLAQVSQVANRSLVSRLRFVDDDRRAIQVE
ncbi:MAG: glycosyltransferase family 2 protein [Janthinobacterium lividum]